MPILGFLDFRKVEQLFTTATKVGRVAPLSTRLNEKHPNPVSKHLLSILSRQKTAMQCFDEKFWQSRATFYYGHQSGSCRTSFDASRWETSESGLKTPPINIIQFVNRKIQIFENLYRVFRPALYRYVVFSRHRWMFRTERNLTRCDTTHFVNRGKKIGLGHFFEHMKNSFAEDYSSGNFV